MNFLLICSCFSLIITVNVKLNNRYRQFMLIQLFFFFFFPLSFFTSEFFSSWIQLPPVDFVGCDGSHMLFSVPLNIQYRTSWNLLVSHTTWLITSPQPPLILKLFETSCVGSRHFIRHFMWQSDQQISLSSAFI